MHLPYKRIDCPRCGGTGTQECSWCGGSGRTKDTSDNIHEHHYVDHYVKCNFCNGTGLTRCSGCSGNGYTLIPN